jgi:hypothetical protein
MLIRRLATSMSLGAIGPVTHPFALTGSTIAS